MILNRKRVRRGSIDFDLPEPVIEFDEHGLMKSITRSERNIAQSSDRRIHARGQRERRRNTWRTSASRPSTAFTKSPTQNASTISK